MNFTCIHCNQSLEIDDDHGGKSVQCPACGRYIVVPVSKQAEQATTSVPPLNARPTTSTVAREQHRINTTEVKVVDFSMPFTSMVVFMIKWAIAAIPAMLILGLIYLVFATLFLGGCAATMSNM